MKIKKSLGKELAPWEGDVNRDTHILFHWLYLFNVLCTTEDYFPQIKTFIEIYQQNIGTSQMQEGNTTFIQS